MVDEKDPGRKSADADSLDDEIIIDLTDEVVLKPEEDSASLNLTENMSEEAQQGAAEKARKSPEAEAFDSKESMLDTSTTDRGDDDDEATQYLELESDELDDILLPEDDHDDTTDVGPPIESAELFDSNELPDIEAMSGLDFEDMEDTADGVALDQKDLDSIDDIFASTAEQTTDSVDVSDQEKDDETATLELEDIDDYSDLIDPHEVDQHNLPLTEEETLIFEDELDSPDLQDDLDADIDDEVIPLDGLGDPSDVPEEDVIEIDEFDQHFPVEDETLLKKTGILDSSDPEEDDFLELIDVEEDILSEDQEVVETNDLPTDNADELISPLLEDDSLLSSSDSSFGDDVEDQMLQEGRSELDLESTAEEKSVDKKETTKPPAEVLEISGETPSISKAFVPQTEDSDFSFDSGSIDQQVDQLDTFLTDEAANETNLTAPPADYPVNENVKEATSDEALTDGASDDSLIAPIGQIDAAIERVINEKFAGKIEHIIYDVIEKAVVKEINRLKSALLDEDANDREPD